MDSTNNANITSTSVAPVTNNQWPLFVTLLAISALCLVITIVLYLMIREKQNCQGWTQFSYLVSLLLFNAVFIPALCPGLTDGVDRNPGCFTLSVLNQYFFVCSKTWLLIISVDMYCMIRKPVNVTQTITRSSYPFTIYSMLGWIFPAIFVASGVILNWKNRKKLPLAEKDDLWTPVPDYGYMHCRIPNWFVWECFVFGNCLFHFFMFLLIGFTIYRQRGNFDSAESRTTRKKQSSLALLFRLFIVVGLSWAYIAIQDLLHAGNINTSQIWFWHVFRCIFFLQGTLISVIIVTNGRTLNNLANKYPKLKACQLPSIRWNFKFILMLIRRTPEDDGERKDSIQSNVSKKTVDSVI